MSRLCDAQVGVSHERRNDAGSLSLWMSWIMTEFAVVSSLISSFQALSRSKVQNKRRSKQGGKGRGGKKKGKRWWDEHYKCHKRHQATLSKASFTLVQISRLESKECACPDFFTETCDNDSLKFLDVLWLLFSRHLGKKLLQTLLRSKGSGGLGQIVEMTCRL